MDYTEDELRARIRALEDIRVAGVGRVRYGDRETQYRTGAEIDQDITYFKGLLTAMAGTTTRPRQFLGTASKGF